MQIHQLIHLYTEVTAYNKSKEDLSRDERSLERALSALDSKIPSIGEGCYGFNAETFVDDERITYLVKSDDASDEALEKIAKVLDALKFRADENRKQSEAILRRVSVLEGAAGALQGYIDSLEKGSAK